MRKTISILPGKKLINLIHDHTSSRALYSTYNKPPSHPKQYKPLTAFPGNFNVANYTLHTHTYIHSRASIKYPLAKLIISPTAHKPNTHTHSLENDPIHHSSVKKPPFSLSLTHVEKSPCIYIYTYARESSR